MVSRSKLFMQLDALETELMDKIVPHLKAAANGDNDLVFCVQRFNALNELKTKTDKTTENLVNLSTQILALKNKLGESSEGSIEERICWYCREWGNCSNARHGDAQALAKQFLQEIEEIEKK